MQLCSVLENAVTDTCEIFLFVNLIWDLIGLVADRINYGLEQNPFSLEIEDTGGHLQSAHGKTYTVRPRFYWFSECHSVPAYSSGKALNTSVVFWIWAGKWVIMYFSQFEF